ncbi:HEAT repeat domain-containing protein [Chitinophaga sancti]|uniref:HEAT repeat domain-containing protein n=1 Tax=Chitinophaga sancti TaxID=1004 RepID=UPI002A751C9E|nr:HEAT repeat domain-containing protein [Chitinophaga sancti]WPQ62295.1 HEAT repeat domain-containing protein [Chitinophaga sancti]
MRCSNLIILFIFFPILHAAGQGKPSPYATRINAILQEMPSPNDSLKTISMKQLEKLGEEGLTTLAMMSQTGNIRVQYALTAYTRYITAALQDSARKTAVKAWCRALKWVPSIPAKNFLISQLQLCGNDVAAATIAPYLVQEPLCDAATRALIQIGGPVAKPTLVYALSKAKGNCRIALINAIGELRYLSGLDAVTALANTKDLRQRRAALMAIANMGNESSDSLLRAAAATAGYVYDSTNATAAYILFAQRMAENWPQEPARKIAARLLKECKSHAQLPARIAALQIMVTVRFNDANMVLGDAAADPDPAFRSAALKMAEKNLNTSNTNYWIDRVVREKGEVKAGMLLLLGESRQRAATRVIQAALNDSNMVVKTAAIKAAGMLGNTTMIAALVYEMNRVDSSTIFLIRDVLLTMRSNMVASTAGISLQNKPPLMQIALLQVLAERKAEEMKARVVAMTQSANPAVKEQAEKTLKAIEGS